MIYYSWSVRWSNPYTVAPDGLPQILMQGVMAPGVKRWSSRYVPGCCKMLIEQFQAQGIYSYSLYVDAHDIKPTRALSLKAKQSIRRKRLEARIRTKYPLFADAMIAEALAAKSDYYGI
jgi:hypothetical protein